MSGKVKSLNRCAADYLSLNIDNPGTFHLADLVVSTYEESVVNVKPAVGGATGRMTPAKRMHRSLKDKEHCQRMRLSNRKATHSQLLSN